MRFCSIQRPIRTSLTFLLLGSGWISVSYAGEIFADRWYLDGDGDRFGAGPASYGSRPSPQHVASKWDCDDIDPARHPGAADAPADGIDQDCGGTEDADAHVGLSELSHATIRDALIAAPRGSTVFVGPGRYFEHDLVMSDDRGVSLIGTHGSERTTVNAQRQGRILHLDFVDDPVWLEGFTFTKGFSVDAADGAAVWIQWSEVTARDLILTASKSDSADQSANQKGGGLSLDNANLDLDGCYIGGNSGRFGGGIYVSGTIWPVRIANCRIENNVAFNNGGGIYAASVDLTLEHVRVAGNWSMRDGGGLSLEFMSGHLFHVEVTGNRASENGGGLDFLTGSAEIDHGVIVNNLSRSAGSGLHLVQNSFVDATNSVFAYNPRFNLYNTDNSDFVSFDNAVYNPPGRPTAFRIPGLVLMLLGEPEFVAYDNRLPIDLHLQTSSPLVDAGIGPDDADGSPPDLGLYGGPLGAERDLDRDGLRAYFWPGAFEQAPPGFDPSEWDCDDLDPANEGCG